MAKFGTLAVALIALLACVAPEQAQADDALKLAVGGRGNWDSSPPELGKRGGIFKKHGLDLELLFTAGAGETQQAVIAGSVDIGIAVELDPYRISGLDAVMADAIQVRLLSASLGKEHLAELFQVPSR